MTQSVDPQTNFLQDSIHSIDASTKRLLVIDDSKTMLQLFSRLLEKLGYRVETAKGGLEGLEKARALRPDLILTDLVMPDLDGCALCRQVKQDTKLKEIPIVLLTTQEGTDNLVDGISAGADDYISKTVDERELDIRIRSMLRLKLLRDELIHLRRLSAVQSMIATLNHEFNNSLVVAYGSLDRLERFVPAEAKEPLKKLNQAVDRIRDTVKALGEIETTLEVPYVGDSKMLSLKGQPD